jgi:hypothetical protein
VQASASKAGLDCQVFRPKHSCGCVPESLGGPFQEFGHRARASLDVEGRLAPCTSWRLRFRFVTGLGKPHTNQTVHQLAVSTKPAIAGSSRSKQNVALRLLKQHGPNDTSDAWLGRSMLNTRVQPADANVECPSFIRRLSFLRNVYI